MNKNSITFLDCTLRDGGYYNAWDFDFSLIQDYIKAVNAAGVNFIELGFRSLNKKGFKGACAYTTDEFLRNLEIPNGVQIGVMVNASEIIKDCKMSEAVLKQLFPEDTSSSLVHLVRIACHTHEFIEALNAIVWLKARGFIVGLNIMQIGERSTEEIETLAMVAAKYPLDILYFADSLGNMNPERISEIVCFLRRHWTGEIGVHTHDNMGFALANTLRAIDKDVTWVDSTVKGMGRGAGNAKTELLAIEIANLNESKCNLIPLMGLISKYFEPLSRYYHWGHNAYYYLSGKYGIHPTYVQEMMADSRYAEEDILAVIEHLRRNGGKKFSQNRLGTARQFYADSPEGEWSPISIFAGKEILLLGTGPGAIRHKVAIESYVRNNKPIVLALNTQSPIDESLIHYRVACHPVRLLADSEALVSLSQPLITPESMLPEDVRVAMNGVKLLDYGLSVQPGSHEYGETYCVLPNALVISYALAAASSGKATRLLLAGFDGYTANDPRRLEVDNVFSEHNALELSVPLISVTPTLYKLNTTSIYAL
jgi:4-hydroxy 2-oxovalerate aldolase